MIGRLPTSLNVNGKEMKIRSDFRDCLLIFQAFNDTDLTDEEQMMVMLQCLYVDYQDFKQDDIEQAINQAVWFLNCGNTVGNPHSDKPLYDFEHDEQIMFASINHVAGREIRLEEYVHFWTFMGYFNEIGEGTFSTVVSIRSKKQKGKKLEKYEQEYYSKNKELIDLPKRYSQKEQEEIDKLLSIL